MVEYSQCSLLGLLLQEIEKTGQDDFREAWRERTKD